MACRDTECSTCVDPAKQSKHITAISNYGSNSDPGSWDIFCSDSYLNGKTHSFVLHRMKSETAFNCTKFRVTDRFKALKRLKSTLGEAAFGLILVFFYVSHCCFLWLYRGSKTMKVYKTSVVNVKLWSQAFRLKEQRGFFCFAQKFNNHMRTNLLTQRQDIFHSVHLRGIHVG